MSAEMLSGSKRRAVAADGEEECTSSYRKDDCNAQRENSHAVSFGSISTQDVVTTALIPVAASVACISSWNNRNDTVSHAGSFNISTARVINFESKGLTNCEPVIEALENIPKDSISSSKPTLTTLNLSRNKLKVIDSQLYSVATLVSLNLSRNWLIKLESGISSLTNLTELLLHSNTLKMSTLPVDELAKMPSLALIDLRYNEKLEKQQAAEQLRQAFGERLRLRDRATIAIDMTAAQIRGSKESACDRDATLLRSQLAPWSTPQLRARLADTFGVPTNVDTVSREQVMDMLLEQYEKEGVAREVVTAEGTPLNPSLVEQLTCTLRNLSWPTSTRERPKVAADKYFTIQRPMAKFTVEDGAKNKKNEAKLEKYCVLWGLLNEALRSVDPFYAELYTGVAVTNGFTDSPHIDTENIGPFYAISFGAFEGGGKIAVESAPKQVTHVNTYHRFAKVDGRFPHCVTPYKGERYSLIYYQTVGETVPITKAVLPTGGDVLPEVNVASAADASTITSSVESFDCCGDGGGSGTTSNISTADMSCRTGTRAGRC